MRTLYEWDTWKCQINTTVWEGIDEIVGRTLLSAGLFSHVIGLSLNGTSVFCILVAFIVSMNFSPTACQHLERSTLCIVDLKSLLIVMIVLIPLYGRLRTDGCCDDCGANAENHQ